MFSVIACASAAGQSEIVACTLTLVTKLLGCGPHEWMEPVNSARKAAERMPHQIMPLHVRQLMKQNRTTAVCAPAVTIRGKNNRRLQESACERHFRFGASKQARRFLELQAICDFPERSEPILRIEWMR